MGPVKLSVRALVEFVLRCGDIDARAQAGGYDRANEGARIHRRLQKAAGKDYKAEVSFKAVRVVDGIEYRLEGRADGIMETPTGYIVDEIKTTDAPAERLTEDYNPLHWAQAKCYAAFLCKEKKLNGVTVQLTYYQVDTEEIVRHRRLFGALELENFLTHTLHLYTPWAKMAAEWLEKRTESLKALRFPFAEYRAGQYRLAGAVYKTIEGGGRLFACAPTGVGKTISTLFPAAKALGEGKAERIFYLTAKTVTRTAAEGAVALLRESQPGLCFKCVTLTAKDKACPLEERQCTPQHCPRAKGYYDRVNDALYRFLNAHSHFTREAIAAFCEAEALCPFEFTLDLSLFCDCIICDYNYLFDPIVYLRRFFDHRDRYAFLIDEAHNLVDRARGMYSAALRKSDFLACKKLADEVSKPLSKALMAVNRQMLSLRKQIAQDTQQEQEHFMTAHTLPEPLLQSLRHLFTVYSTTLEQNRRLPLQPSLFSFAHSLAPELMQLYFDLRFFLRISDLFDERFCFFAAASGSQLTVKLLCLDPAQMVDERLKLGRCTALFSATLSPPSYYKAVLGCDSDEQTHSYALPSPFVQEKLCLLVCNQINTRWAMREQSLEPIARLLFEMVSAKAGNYIAYFPSYQYLQKEAEVFSQLYPQLPLVLQSPQEDDFLAQFDQPHPERSLLGFAVLGGIYSEGVDLQGEKLLGCAIIGTGLPKVGAQQEILREYFQQKNNSGYDFAYRFPGMNKVLQAAGRVIRSPQDRGVVLLLDDRFTTAAYQRLFPAHWSHARILSDSEQLRQTLCTFWESQADNNG